MRTLLPDELKEQPLVKLALGFTLVVMVLFVAAGFLLYFQQMDLSASSVVAYFQGSPEQLHPAPSLDAMLRAAEVRALGVGMALLVLSLVLIRSSISDGAKKAIIILTFSAAIVDEGSSWLVRYGVEAFALVKVLAFLLFQLSFIILILMLAAAFLRPARKLAEPVAIARPALTPFDQRAPQQQRQRRPQQRQQQQQQQQQQQGGGHQGMHRRRRRRRGRGRGPGTGGAPPQQGAPPPAT